MKSRQMSNAILAKQADGSVTAALKRQWRSRASDSKRARLPTIAVAFALLVGLGFSTASAQCRAGGNGCNVNSCGAGANTPTRCNITCAVDDGAGCTGDLDSVIMVPQCSPSLSGTNCPSPADVCDVDDWFGATWLVEFDETGTIDCDDRDIVSCWQIVECGSNPPNVACSGCTTGTIGLDANGLGDWAPGQTFGCNPGTGTWQFQVRTVDVTGVSGCNTCTGGCPKSAGCSVNMDCATAVEPLNLVTSCCIEHD